jgi:hypothetical protein
MLYTILAFILTTLEMGSVVLSFAVQNQEIFYNMLVYGSPFYLIQHAFGAGSIINEKNPLYVALFLFHIIKYFIIFQSQRLEEPTLLRRMAVLFEALYIGLSTYYLL